MAITRFMMMIILKKGHTARSIAISSDKRCSDTTNTSLSFLPPQLRNCFYIGAFCGSQNSAHSHIPGPPVQKPQLGFFLFLSHATTQTHTHTSASACSPQQEQNTLPDGDRNGQGTSYRGGWVASQWQKHGCTCFALPGN